MTEADRQQTILVVEDDLSMLEITSFLLEDEGFAVIQARNGQEGLAVLDKQTPDLIISDVMMPGLDGFGFYQRVHEKPGWSQIPFIFLTAKGQRTDVRRGMGLGADDYLIKPFEPEELLSAVEVRLARAAETKAAISEASATVSQRIVQTLTHEFRTPLALVVGYTDLLESSGETMDDQDRQMILHGLHSGSQRLIQLVEDFLLLSNIETGALAKEIAEGSTKTVKADWIVSMVVEEFESQANARQVKLTTNLGAGSAAVEISHRALSEIVRKLVDNAIKFSQSQEGQIVVNTGQEEGSWVLQVADNGIGIRQEALPWIFDAFRQVDRDKMEQQGAGVGLAIVRGLCEVYGGGVAVKSAPGKGTIFTARLPLAEP